MIGQRLITGKGHLMVLGLTITSKLNFHLYKIQAKKKCDKMIGALKRSSYKLPKRRARKNNRILHPKQNDICEAGILESGDPGYGWKPTCEGTKQDNEIDSTGNSKKNLNGQNIFKGTNKTSWPEEPRQGSSETTRYVSLEDGRSRAPTSPVSSPSKYKPPNEVKNFNHTIGVQKMYSKLIYDLVKYWNLYHPKLVDVDQQNLKNH